MSQRNVYRVNYLFADVPQAENVVAASEAEAIKFFGIQDGHATAIMIASGVEIVGVDEPHALIPPKEVFKAPPQPEKQFTDAELVRLRQILARG
jgi:hypothetical protein